MSCILVVDSSVPVSFKVLVVTVVTQMLFCHVNDLVEGLQYGRRLVTTRTATLATYFSQVLISSLLQLYCQV